MGKFVEDTALTRKWGKQLTFSCLSAHFSSFHCFSCCHTACPHLPCFVFFYSCKRHHWCWLYHEYRNVCGDLLMSFLVSFFYAYFAPDLAVVILRNLKCCISLLVGAEVVTGAFAPVCTFEGSSSVCPVQKLCLTFHSSSSYIVHGFCFWPKKKGFGVRGCFALSPTLDKSAL